MNLNQLTPEHIQNARANFPALECPKPDKELIEQTCLEATADHMILHVASEMHCSGLYYLALLAREVNAHSSHVCKPEELTKFAVPGTDAIVVLGDLTIDGDLLVTTPFVVTGNLTINGSYTDIGSESPVAILGNVVCKSMRTTGWVIIGGNCTVQGYYYGHYNDDAFELIGTLKAIAVITEEHQIEAGSYDVEYKPAEGGYWGDTIFDSRDVASIHFLIGLGDQRLYEVISKEELEDSL